MHYTAVRSKTQYREFQFHGEKCKLLSIFVIFDTMARMKKDIIPYAQSVLREEAEAIIRVSDRLSGAFTEALDLMLA